MTTEFKETQQITTEMARAAQDHMRSAQDYRECLNLLEDRLGSTDPATGNLAWLAVRASLQAYGAATGKPCSNQQNLQTMQEYLNVDSITPAGLLNQYGPMAPDQVVRQGIREHLESITEDLDELAEMTRNALVEAGLANAGPTESA